MKTPEKLRVASAGNEGEWLVGVLVDRWIKFADNFIQDLRCNLERGSAVTVVGRVADPVDGVLRKKKRLGLHRRSRAASRDVLQKLRDASGRYCCAPTAPRPPGRLRERGSDSLSR
jgi:hypothetical protein